MIVKSLQAQGLFYSVIENQKALHHADRHAGRPVSRPVKGQNRSMKGFQIICLVNPSLYRLEAGVFLQSAAASVSE